MSKEREGLDFAASLSELATRLKNPDYQVTDPDIRLIERVAEFLSRLHKENHR